MFLQNIELLPVNLSQIVFAGLTGFGALLIWDLERYRNLAAFKNEAGMTPTQFLRKK